MSEESERVVVIQDVSRDISASAIRRIIQALSLKPGDALKFLGVLHQLNNPSMLKYMGYKTRLESSSMFGTNQKIIAEEILRKKKEYRDHEEIVKISRECENEKIEFDVEVRAGSSLKVVAVRYAKKFKATWVILDRHIKKERRYFMENLSCRISRMKRDNSIKEVRGEKEKAASVTYDEMIPGSPKHQLFATKYEIRDKKKPNSPRQYCKTSTEPEPDTLNFEEEIEDTLFSIDLSKESFARSRSSNSSSPQGKKIENSESLKLGVCEKWVCSVCKNRRPNNIKIPPGYYFSYSELQAATEGFSPKNFLSEGGFGSVYRGEINGLKIAVKLYNKKASFQGEKEFKSEVEVLSKARHENLVMLLGSCSEGNHRLLVYEYVCNGSLDQHLSKHARKPLSWEKRMKIAMGAAKGLQYLHDNNIIHRDMRPNNILVTHDFESLLGDFGLAKTQCEDSDHSSQTGVVGTLGYLAPEYAECGKVSIKTDVYSFGVVLLQLITGLKTTDKKLRDNSLVGWARPLLKEKNYPDLIDPRILDCHDVYQLFWMVRVAENCLSKDPEKRLPMHAVVEALKYIMEGKASSSSNIRGFSSPAPSDSASSSYGDGDGDSSEDASCLSTSVSVDSFTINTHLTSTLSPPMHLQLPTRRRLPPSPPQSIIN